MGPTVLGPECLLFNLSQKPPFSLTFWESMCPPNPIPAIRALSEVGVCPWAPPHKPNAQARLKPAGARWLGPMSWKPPGFEGARETELGGWDPNGLNGVRHLGLGVA